MSEQVSPTTTSSSQDENQNKDTPVSWCLKKGKMIKEDARKKKNFEIGILKCSEIITFREQKIMRKVLNLNVEY